MAQGNKTYPAFRTQTILVRRINRFVFFPSFLSWHLLTIRKKKYNDMFLAIEVLIEVDITAHTVSRPSELPGSFSGCSSVEHYRDSNICSGLT